jgi:CheY-like chemotaxis protein
MKPPVVLVADDNAAVVELVRAALQSDGIEVVAASDGEEAAALAYETRPAVMILDLLMPRLDGLSVLARLRGDAVTRDIPVIVVTGMPGSEGARLAEAYGAIAVVPKPFRLLDLADRVRSLLAAQAALVTVPASKP